MQPSLSYFKTGKTERWLIKQQLNMQYLWWAIVSIMNAALVIVFYRTELLSYFSGIFSVGNFLLAILIRNELILHLLYQLAVSVSKRIAIGKYYINASVHHLGAVHAASASWGFMWLLINELQHLNDLNRVVLVTTSFPLLILLLSIIVTATPLFRRRFHTVFEKSHRCLGWISLAILTLHIVLLHFSVDSRQAPSLKAILVDPMFLMATVMIGSIAVTWISLRRCDCFTIQRSFSDVLVITVPGTANVETFAQISLDLIRWHSFSIAGMYFDQRSGELNVELMIRATNEWTASVLDRHGAQFQRNHIYQKNLPDRIWIRSVKSPDFMLSIHAYSWALIIATETGIVSVLPYIATSGHKLCLLWIGDISQEFYSEQVWSILCTHPFLEIYDAGLDRDPNVSELAAKAIAEFRPEAVFCVSNKAVTEIVTKVCLAKGIPAYGIT